jgi:hypothetical protein
VHAINHVLIHCAIFRYNESEAIRDAVALLYPLARNDTGHTGGRGVVASDAFDDFIADIAPYVGTLPVVTAELGDTWMMGADADPCVVVGLGSFVVEPQ